MSELKLPELGEGIDAVDVSAVLVAVGDLVSLEQPVIEVETEKASLEVPADSAGRVVELLVRVGDKVRVGQTILKVEGGGIAAGAPATERHGEPVPVPAPRAAESEARPDEATAEVVEFPHAAVAAPPTLAPPVPAAPSVRALARQLGVDVARVRGTGPGGRISREDVKAAAKAIITGKGAPVASATAPELPDFSTWGPVEREPLSNVRRATARGMAVAWATVPHVTQFDHADVTRLEELRRGFNASPEAAGSKLSLTAIAVKLVAGLLKQFPRFNASLDLAGDAVVYKRYVHVGVAVDTERGLLVPVLRDVDRKGVLQVAAELDGLAERARTRKIGPDELRGATFTVSNLGGLGTTWFSPIVNWPEVAILGVGRAEHQAVWVEGRFEPRLLLPLSLSYDHRLIDGADAARFLRRLAEALEQPLLLLLGQDAK